MTRHGAGTLLVVLLTGTLTAQLPLPFPLVHFHAGASGDGLGTSTTGIGDVDGDGRGDYAVGAPGDRVAGVMLGTVTAFSGRTGSALWTAQGPDAGSGFGTRMSTVGDLDGDGTTELIVGAPFADVGMVGDAGRAFVLSGADGTILRSHDGVQAGELFGFGVAGGVDVDGDGVSDDIIGAPNFDLVSPTAPTQSRVGRVLVVSGSTGATIHDIQGDASERRLGSGVGGFSDIDGNGCDEFVYAQQVVFPLGPGAFLTVASGDTGSTLSDLFSPEPFHQFASGFDTRGDLNGDGFRDIVAGAPGFDGTGVGRGRLFVFDGSLVSGVLSGTTLLIADGEQNLQGFASVVAFAGDVNGDGVTDVFGSALPPFGTGAPYAQVVSGADSSILDTFVGPPGEIISGLGSAGDTAGDGLDEVLVGASNAGVGGRLAVFSVACGARSYGEGLGTTHPLVASWNSGPVGNATAGGLDVNGAAAGGTGVAVLSATPDVNPMFGITLLVDLGSPAPLQVPVTYDGNGEASFAFDLRQPVIAGVPFFAQFFEINFAAPFNVFASNGVELVFCP